MNRVKVKSRMKDRFLIALAPVLLASTLAIGVIGLATPAGAVTMTTETTVTLLRTGWDADSFAVVTAAPIINPAHCATPDGYITAKSFPGYQTYYWAAQQAFIDAYYNLPDVTIAVDDSRCFAGRPLLVGINIVPPSSLR